MSALIPLNRDWKGHLGDLIQRARCELVIVTPYITLEGSEFVASRLPPPLRTTGRIDVLTDLSPTPICQGSTDPKAILAIRDAAHSLRLWHLARVHAKVYISDAERAIVTSGNLTRGGLAANFEYGIELGDRTTVASIRADILELMKLGTPVDGTALGNYCAIAERIRSTFRQQLNRMSQEATAAFDRVVRRAEDELVRLRLASGPMHAVFSNAILYLLRREGPTKTADIHHFVQSLYPDLCDDSIDRVIDGRRFGKKWKHAVRTAQQHLKGQGFVEYERGLWQIASNTFDADRVT